MKVDKKRIKSKKDLIKKIELVSNMREKMAKNSLILMDEVAQKNGIELDSLRIYDKTYAEYIGDYVRVLYQKNKRICDDEKALEILNKDLMKQLQAVYLGKSKVYNASNAYKLFVDISFYIQSKIAEKYGVESFHDIESSGNLQAIEEKKKFEEWKKVRIETLEKATKMNRDEMLSFYKKPKKRIQSDNAGYIYFEDIIYPLTLLVFAPVSVGIICLLLKDLTEDKYLNELNAIASDLGFSDYEELYDYLGDAGYEFLSNEEKNVLVETWLNERDEIVANNYGFDSLEDALNAIDDKREITTNLEEYNANIVQQKELFLEKMANYWGFDSIDDVEQYLNIKKTLIQSGSNEGLSPEDMALKESFENIYNYFNSQTKPIGSDIQGEIISDETLNSLNNELIANEMVLKSIYQGFFESHNEYFYANNATTQMIGDNLIDHFGGDNFPAYEERNWKDALLDTMQLMNNSVGGSGGTGGASGDSSFLVENATGLAGAGAGLLDVAALATAVKHRQTIGAWLKMRKHKEFAEMQKAIEKEKKSEKSSKTDISRDM